MAAWPWELTDSAEIWSAAADWIMAIGALATLVFLLVDRFRPRKSLVPAWVKRTRTKEPGATLIGIHAVSLMAEPLLLRRISVDPGHEFSLRPTDYSPSKRAASKYADDSSPLEWRRAINFVHHPRWIPRAGTDQDEPAAIVRIFVRKRQKTAQAVELRLEFGVAGDPKRLVKQDVRFELLKP